MRAAVRACAEGGFLGVNLSIQVVLFESLTGCNRQVVIGKSSDWSWLLCFLQERENRMPPKKQIKQKIALSVKAAKSRPVKGSAVRVRPPSALIDKIYATIRACGRGTTRSAIKKYMRETYSCDKAPHINKALAKAEDSAVGTLYQSRDSFSINETILSGKGWRVEVYNELVNCQIHPTIFFLDTEKEAKAFQIKANDYLVLNKSGFDKVHQRRGGCVWITGLVDLYAGATLTRSVAAPVRCADATRAFSILTHNILAWDKECEKVKDAVAVNVEDENTQIQVPS